MIKNHATSPKKVLLSTSDVQSTGTGHDIANHVLVLCNFRCKYDIKILRITYYYKWVKPVKFSYITNNIAFYSKRKKSITLPVQGAGS